MRKAVNIGCSSNCCLILMSYKSTVLEIMLNSKASNKNKKSLGKAIKRNYAAANADSSASSGHWRAR